MEVDVKVNLLDEKCKDCPKLKLETVCAEPNYFARPVYVHQCSHIHFCREVRKSRGEE